MDNTFAASSILLSSRVAMLMVLRLTCSTLGLFEHLDEAKLAVRVAVRRGSVVDISRKTITYEVARLLQVLACFFPRMVAAVVMFCGPSVTLGSRSGED